MSIYDLLPAPTRVEYLSDGEHRRLKAKLTRALNDGDPLKVLAAVEDALMSWHGKAWPDEWSRWARALEDAYAARVRGLDAYQAIPHGELLRWQRAAREILR